MTKCVGCDPPFELDSSCNQDIINDSGNCYKVCPYRCDISKSGAISSQTVCEEDTDCTSCGSTKFRVNCDGTINDTWGLNTVWFGFDMDSFPINTKDTTTKDTTTKDTTTDLLALQDNDDLLSLDNLINNLGILVNDYKYLYEDYTTYLITATSNEYDSYEKFNNIQKLKKQIEKLIDNINSAITKLNNKSDVENMELLNETKNFELRKKEYEKELNNHKVYINKLNNKLGKLNISNQKVVSSHIYLIFVSLLLFFVIIITINAFNDKNINMMSLIITIILVLIIIYYNFNVYMP